MKVVIVGGGFGGVKAALHLANKKGLDVKLISNQAYFEYHAALYRSATGRSPLEVAIPLRDFFDYAKNVEVLSDTITDIDADARRVTSESGSKYDYDKLILALGNVTEYYGIKGLDEYSYGVKTIHQALKLKHHLHDQLISSEADHNYVVIGAGATGVELSAEFSAYLRKIRQKHKITHKFHVHLIEANDRPMPAMPEDFSAKITKRLKKLGVVTHFNTPVQSETKDGIQLPQGLIPSQTVVWTAGVANNPFFSRFASYFTASKNGKIKVNEQLQALPDVYVIGDSADTPYSGLAQTALHDATLVADNLIREANGKPLRKYKPKRPIYAIPVGSRWAAVLWGKLRIYGLLGWGLRRFTDLKLYLTFLPLKKALTTWRYGFMDEEICDVCKD